MHFIMFYSLAKSSEGIFPSELKLEKIVPLFNTGDPQDPNNYRPISILPALSKVFEKLFLNRLISFLDKNKILSNSQFGF